MLTSIIPAPDLNRDRMLTSILPAPDFNRDRMLTSILPAPDFNRDRMLTSILPAPDFNRDRILTSILSAPDLDRDRMLTSILPASDFNRDRMLTSILPAPDFNMDRMLTSILSAPVYCFSTILVANKTDSRLALHHMGSTTEKIMGWISSFLEITELSRADAPDMMFKEVNHTCDLPNSMNAKIWARSCENVSYAICEQQRRRSACGSAQSDQRLCCSLLG